MPCRAVRAVGLIGSPGSDAAVALLSPGDRFEVLEVSGALVWGRAVEAGLVGYLDSDAVEAEA